LITQLRLDHLVKKLIDCAFAKRQLAKWFSAQIRDTNLSFFPTDLSKVLTPVQLAFPWKPPGHELKANYKTFFSQFPMFRINKLVWLFKNFYYLKVGQNRAFKPGKIIEAYSNICN
jgi:hypothetical protein